MYLSRTVRFWPELSVRAEEAVQRLAIPTVLHLY